MSNFVNKIKKGETEYDIQDARIPDGAVPGIVKAEDGKQQVDEVIKPVRPVPVITIDGVDYFHSQTFDVNELYSLAEQSQSGKLNLLTGESTSNNNMIVSYGRTWQVEVALKINQLSTYLKGSNVGTPYTSRAFTKADLADDAGCVAAYGYISDDKSTFIFYYNLEDDDIIVSPITKIKDANDNEVDINDSRLTVTSEDVGKFVGVNDDGELTLMSAARLYNHHIVFTSDQVKLQYAATIDGSISAVDVAKIEVNIVTSHRNISDEFKPISCAFKFIFNSSFGLEASVIGYAECKDSSDPHGNMLRLSSRFFTFGDSSGPAHIDAGFYSFKRNMVATDADDTVTPLQSNNYIINHISKRLIYQISLLLSNKCVL